MKKGFTLIELLGVLIILSLIIVLVAPSIINVVKNGNDKKDETILELIYNAADIYVKDNIDYYPKIASKENYISLSDLEGIGGVNKELLSKYSENNIEDNKLIKVTYTTKYEYKLVDKSSHTPSQIFVEIPKPLVPVIYNENNWQVADKSTEWYNYDEQKWANAVLLNDGITKDAGDILDINNDVRAMFVYIPRYEYKIEGEFGKGGTSKESPGEIEINFISKNKTTSTDGYIIHPAFTFGKKELYGIWVGKFETTGTDDFPTILPDAHPIVNQNVSTQFKTAQKFNNIIVADSHMTKNVEWGAVAYLSQSKYGKYGNTDFEVLTKEVYINNSGSFYTGRSGGNVTGSTPINGTYPEQTSTETYDDTGFYTYDGYLLEYNTNNKTTRDILKGTGASTTGNIYGIYDMVGGVWEHVMANYNNKLGNSGFTKMPNSKYYDLFTDSNFDTACGSTICYGQALIETKKWYNDMTDFLSDNQQWLGRGGRSINRIDAGIFSTGYTNGRSGINYYGFRTTLVN